MASEKVIKKEDIDLHADPSAQSESFIGRIMSAIKRYAFTESTPAPKVQVYITVPPDNSWDIVAAGFFCLFISQGIMYSHGKIMTELSETLHVKISQATLLGSVQVACFYFFGPFASAIVNNYGFRIAGCLGAVMSTAGFLLCFGVPNMESILFGYGILCGAGFGITYAVVSIIVGLNFEKYRALATAITMSGSGFGTVTVTPLVDTMLLKKTGIGYIFLLYAGLATVTFFLSLVFRQLDPVQVVLPDDKTIRVQLDPEDADISDSEITLDRFPSHNTIRSTKIPTYHDLYNSPQQSWFSVRRSKDTSPDSKCKSFFNHCCCCQKPKRPSVKTAADEITIWEPSIVSRPLYRDDIFYDRDLDLLSEYLDSGSLKSEAEIIPKSVSVQMRSTKPQGNLDFHLNVTRAVRFEVAEEQRCCSAPIKHALQLLFDPQLLKSPKYIGLAFVAFFFALGSTTPYIFLSDLADLNGVPAQQSVWLLSIVGMCNVIGRLSVSTFSFLPKLNATCSAGVLTFLSGLTTVVYAYNSDATIYYVYLYCGCFGFFAAYFPTLRLSIFVDHLGLAKLTNAVGLSSVFMGFGSMFGAPVSGLLYEQTGSFKYAFMYSGVCHVLSGCILVVVYITSTNVKPTKAVEKVG